HPVRAGLEERPRRLRPPEPRQRLRRARRAALAKDPQQPFRVAAPLQGLDGEPPDLASLDREGGEPLHYLLVLHAREGLQRRPARLAGEILRRQGEERLRVVEIARGEDGPKLGGATRPHGAFGGSVLAGSNLGGFG